MEARENKAPINELFVINKDALQARLDAMNALPADWDGFGTSPISPAVFRICTRLVELVGPDCVQMKIFVGVNTPGSAFIEMHTLDKTLELTVTSGGTIFYDEIVNGQEVGSGMFLLSKKKLNELLSS